MECDYCSKRIVSKRKHCNLYLLVEWEAYFCDKCYDEITKIIKQTKKDYQMLNSIWNAKPTTVKWSALCKIEEWIMIEWLFRNKKGVEGK